MATSARRIFLLAPTNAPARAPTLPHAKPSAAPRRSCRKYLINQSPASSAVARSKSLHPRRFRRIRNQRLRVPADSDEPVDLFAAMCRPHAACSASASLTQLQHLARDHNPPLRLHRWPAYPPSHPAPGIRVVAIIDQHHAAQSQHLSAAVRGTIASSAATHSANDTPASSAHRSRRQRIAHVVPPQQRQPARLPLSRAAITNVVPSAPRSSTPPL